MSAFRLHFVQSNACLTLALLAGGGSQAWGQESGTSSGGQVSPPPSATDVSSAMMFDQLSRVREVMRNFEGPEWRERMQLQLADELARKQTDAERFAALPARLPILAETVPAGIAASFLPESRDKLADSASETYFIAYTSLLRQNQLSGARARRVAAHVARRADLLRELRAALGQAAALPPGEQVALLARSAREQAPACQAFEAEEEAIRLDFTTRAPFKQYEDGIRLPVAQTRELPPAATELLFAAQFESGLSPAQRELLQGVAQDLAEPSQSDSPAFSFWPARARLRVPEGLSADLTARLQKIQRLKQQLALEVLDALNQPRGNTRAAALAALATKQAGQLESIDALADEIRPQLATFYPAVPPPPDDVPAALRQQVQRAFARKLWLQQQVTTELRELRRMLPNDKVSLVQNGSIPSIVVAARPPGDRAPRLTPAEKTALRDRLQKTNALLEHRTRTLTAESQALQVALREYRDQVPHAREQNLGRLAASLAESISAKEIDRLYRDYRDAMFQPGLSPEQRRLLLRGALVDVERERLRDPWAE